MSVIMSYNLKNISFVLRLKLCIYSVIPRGAPEIAGMESFYFQPGAWRSMSNVADQTQHEYHEDKSSTAVDDGGDQTVAVQDTAPAKSVEEMRSSPRKKFQVNQRIAPMHSEMLPRVDEYFKVECNDISRGGISFYLKRPPGCKHFAIALGQKPSITVLIAKVVYSREVDHDDQRMYLVGCQFIDRLQS